MLDRLRRILASNELLRFVVFGGVNTGLTCLLFLFLILAKRSNTSGRENPSFYSPAPSCFSRLV